jgi:uncharacterized lipoprotein YbaY
VVIPTSIPAFSSGTLQVWLEDVSYADRAATVVAETTIAGVSHAPRPHGDAEVTVIEFGLQPPHEIDPSADYSIRVSLHVPAREDRDGLVLESDEVHPVLTRGHASEVTVRLERSQPLRRGSR